MPAAPACPRITSLQDYLHGQLAPPEADDYRRHLSECPYCQAAAGFASSPSLETFVLPEEATQVAVAVADATVAQTPAAPADDRTEVATVRTRSIADDEWEDLPAPAGDDSGEWPALPATPESSAATEQMEAGD